MNKKLIRNIILAVVVIAVLGVAYFFAMKWEPKNPEDEVIQKESPNESVVVSIPFSDIKSVELNNSNGKFAIVKDGGKYTVPGYENANLSSARLAGPFMKLEKIVAEREITENINLDDYGFLKPVATVTVTKTDSEKVQIIIGNMDPTSFGYYVKTNLSESVYLVDQQSLKDFFVKVDDFKNKHIADVSFESLESFELFKGNEKVTSIRKRNETDTLTDIVIEQLIMTYPYYEYISLEELAVPFEGLESIIAIEEVSSSASKGKAFGIGAYTIKITDGYGNLTLKLGNKASDGNVYAVCEGVDAVFKIPGEWLKAAEEFVPFDYLYKLTNVYMIDEVSSVDFVCPDGVYKLERSDNKYLINGSVVDEQTYKDVYTIFVSMAFTGDGQNTKIGKEIGSVTFRFNDGTTAASVYYEADERNYLVIKADGSKYLVLKKNFDPVFKSVSELLK